MSSQSGTMTSSGSKLFTGLPPKVTGLSPKEGPPGTKITIRGENLGKSEDDLIGVSICDVDCLIWAEWMSDKKILVRSGLAYGTGDVIVFTKSGGIGTCTVQFRSIKEVLSPTKESAVWVNEEEHFSFVNTRHRNSVSPTPFAEPDPLGLLDNQSRISGDSNDEIIGNRRRFDHSTLLELFPEALECPPPDSDISSADQDTEFDRDVGNLNSMRFLPGWYLLEHYHSVHFDELKRGLRSLKARNQGTGSTNGSRQEDNDERGPIQLLKPNVLAVIECLDALKSVHVALKKDKQELGIELTGKIEECVKKATSEAHDIFDDILARKDTVDSTRNALNVLQRYRFLFNLPSAIEANVQKGDHDALIADYIRARSLFAETPVNVFRRVYREVEQRIERFKQTLADKLIECVKDSSIRDVDQIRRHVRHLTHLEAGGNPGWQCIVTLKDQLLDSMNQTRDRHLALAAQQQNVSGDDFDDNEERDEPPQAVQFVEDLLQVFNACFEDLVRLCNHYLNGELYANETKEQLKAKEMLVHSDMLQRPIDQLVICLRAALLPESLRTQTDTRFWPTSNRADEHFVRWLPHCLRLAVACHSSLATYDLPCASMLQPFQQFVFDLRVHSLTCVFRQAAEEVQALHVKETWDVTLDDQIGTRSQLPLLFEAKVEEILRLVRETILQLPSADEPDIFTKLHVQGQMKQLAQNLLAAFLVTLEQTLDDTPSLSSTTSSSSLHKKSANYHHMSLADRLLIVVCNCVFTNTHVIPRLHESFDRYNYPDMQSVVKMVQARCRELESKLFARFVAEKCSIVSRQIRDSLPATESMWKSNATSAKSSLTSGVSPFVLETLMCLIAVQSDVFALCPTLVRKVMLKVIEAALEELLKAFQETVSSADSNRTEINELQANLDIGALQCAFDNVDFFRSAGSVRVMQSMRSLVRPLSNSSQSQLLQQQLAQFRQASQLQMNAFRWNSEQVVIAL